jgi:SAM-dependent methyltransferase
MDSKPALLARVLARRVARPVRRMLVVGCGSGLEALALQREFGCEVTGIDVETRFDPLAAQHVRLQYGDARSMAFDDASFDFVYSYHALEHIPQHHRALSEMARVLTPGGHFCIGTPNRSRLLGYLGTNTPLRDKLRWNAADWQMRLRGRFRNEFGAHAGFTESELAADLTRAFGMAEPISLDYYLAIYPHRAGLIRTLDRTGIDRFAFPSVYFFGQAAGAGVARNAPATQDA